MSYRELLKRKLLENVYMKMSDEEKRAFVQLTMQNRNHQEIMQALQSIRKEVDTNHHSWLSDFGANIAGNAVFDGAVWLLSRLIKRL